MSTIKMTNLLFILFNAITSQEHSSFITRLIINHQIVDQINPKHPVLKTLCNFVNTSLLIQAVYSGSSLRIQL